MSAPLDGPPVLFLDLDGTVRRGKDELGRFVNTAADVVIFPEALERIRAWRAAGGVAIGVTNQAGVALGHLPYSDLRANIDATRLAADLDFVVACTHHPDAGCWCRKPTPGLIISGLDYWSREEGHGWPPRHRCLMVGDRPEDEGAAAAAGVRFMWASCWRAMPVEELAP